MKIMVSACLLGDNCKYDGHNNLNNDLKKYLEKYEVIKICPEVMGGLTIPRVPAEIKNDYVITKDGMNVTDNYIKGAEHALKLAIDNNIKIAILKKNSPSCGYGFIYDGTFTHTKRHGNGITANLLKEKGIVILNEDNYKEYLDNYE